MSLWSRTSVRRVSDHATGRIDHVVFNHGPLRVVVSADATMLVGKAGDGDSVLDEFRFDDLDGHIFRHFVLSLLMMIEEQQ